MDHTNQVLELLCSAKLAEGVPKRAADLVAQGWLWLHDLRPHTTLGDSEVLSACYQLQRDGALETMVGVVDSMNCAVRVTKRGHALNRRHLQRASRAAHQTQVAAEKERAERRATKMRQVAGYEAATRGVLVTPPAHVKEQDSSSSPSLSLSPEDRRELDRSADREAQLRQVMEKEIWGEGDLAVFFNVKVDTIRHMKSRGEIPGTVNINNRLWRIHRDVLIAHFKSAGMPHTRKGRPQGSKPKPR